MIPDLLKILWLLMPLFGLTAALLGWNGTKPPINWSLAALFALGLLCWTYLSIRLLSFHKRLFHFLRLLLAGDYETGIRSPKHFTDEVSALENLSNQVSDRLRAYDRLRADRVSIYSRALDLIVRQSNQGLITANVEKETFVFNPVAQKRLGISRKSFSFESILKPVANQPFGKLFDRAVSGRKTNTQGRCSLKLPGMQSPEKLSFLIMPLRDRDETVRFAVIFIDS